MVRNIQFDRVKKIRVSDTVVDQIITLIKNGTLSIGDQLPSERELVEQFQVARASVREALRIMEFRGIIEVQPGKGTFIVGNIENLYYSEECIRKWFRDHADEYQDVFEVREILEGRAARRLAANISDEGIQELQDLISRAVASVPSADWDEIIYVDRKFHHLIGLYSGNTLLSELVDITYEVTGTSTPSLLLIPGRAEISLKQHQRIIDSIASRDPDAAENAVIDHIRNVQAAIETIIN